MRSIPRPLKITALLIALLITTVAIGWLTRLQWIPYAVNQQFDDLTLTNLDEMTLSPAKHGFSAHINHARLIYQDYIEITLEDIKLENLLSLLHPWFGGKRDTHQIGASGIDLYLNSVKIQSIDEEASPERKKIPAPKNNDQALNPRRTSSELPPSKQTEDTETKEALKIGQVLQALNEQPFRKLTVHQLLWAEQLDGTLSLTANKIPGQAVRGVIQSNRCPDCRLTFNVQFDVSKASAQLKLIQGDGIAATFDGGLFDGRIFPLSISKSSAAPLPPNWKFDTHLKIISDQLGALFNAVGFSQSTATPVSASTQANNFDWIAILHSLEGNIDIRTTGEATDTFSGAESLSRLATSLTAPILKLALPENIGGVPLAISASTKQPVNVKILSASPLKISSIEGDIGLSITPLTESASNTVLAGPMLETDIALITEQKTPNLKFQGRYDLAQASPLISSEKWKDVFKDYRISHLEGVHTFSGSATLPGINNPAINTNTSILKSLSMEIFATKASQFLLKPTQKENLLAAIQWNDALIKFNSETSVKISAKSIPGNLRLNLESLNIEAAPTKNSLPTKDAGDLQFIAQLSKLQCIDLPSINCSMQIGANIKKLELVDSDTTLSDAKLDISLEISKPFQSDTAELSVDNVNLVSEHLKREDLHIKSPEIFIQQAKCQFIASKFQCDIPSLAINIDPLSLEKFQLSGALFLEELKLKKNYSDNDAFSAQAKFKTDRLNVNIFDEYAADINSAGQLKFSDNKATGHGAITSGPVSINLSWAHNLDSGKGSLNLNIPETAFTQQAPLKRALQGLPVDIVDGKLAANAQIRWPELGQDEIHLSVKNTTIQYDDIFAVGINTTVNLEKNGDHWITASPTPVSVNTMDTGIAVNNLNFMLSITQNGDLSLSNFSAELLEGVLTSKNLYWNLRGEVKQSRLQFTGLSIGALAKQMDAQNFAASGLLDAVIPLTTDSQGITVENGILQSRPPGGRLRYYGAFSASMLGSNPQLKLLAGALEDYTYRDIHGTISYPLSGDLQLNLKLTGRSSAIDANRDLIINLNLENNIPIMLRSLQASRDLTDVLERRVK